MKRPSLQFYPSDWRKDPALSVCSLAARGLWVEMMCIAHESQPYGHLALNGQPMSDAQIARLVGESQPVIAKLIGELEDSGVFSRTGEGVIFSRRMVADEHLRNVRAAAGSKGGNPALMSAKDNQEVVGKVNHLLNQNKEGSPALDKHLLNQNGKQNPTPSTRARTDAPARPCAPSSSSSSSSSTSVNVNNVPTGTLSSAPGGADDRPVLVAGKKLNGHHPATIPDCPHGAIVALWAAELPQLPQPRSWTTSRRRHLQARWRELAVLHGWRTADDGLQHFRRLFAYIGQSEFLTGRSRATHGRQPFVVELPWLLVPENMAKVIEGKYHPTKETA